MSPKCPYCNVELYHEDMYDEDNDDNYVYQYWNGHCLNCSRNFIWKERYKFTDFYDLEEVKELE